MLNINQVPQVLFENAKSESFAGYDPFDGLNSKLFTKIPFVKKGLFGLAWVQLHKRSPINLRPVLGVPKARNPKGVGLFILGMLEQYQQTKDASLLTQACELADWLLTQQSDETLWQHACWGYHFDWNARAFFVPKGKPNIITTIYVAQALFELSKLVDKPLYRDVAFDAADFIVKKLYTVHEGRSFFSYIPGETAFVHNASLWGAAWVAIVAVQKGNLHYAELALEVARQSVAEQANDGSWVYGSRHHHQFIDGFHTGYNLEALHHLRKALGVTDFDQAIAKGLAYYKAELFEVDGTAKYYHSNRYPLDMHSVAQAIITFARVGGSREEVALAEKTINWSFAEMYLPKQQRFVYQKYPLYTNRINYIRWTQAWVYYSFSLFNRIKAEQNAKN